MKIYENIRFIRKLKGWSQEEVANQLEMSVNGYGSIERGETDVKLSRLEQIAHVFGIELLELFGLNEKSVFNLIGIYHTQFYHSLINSSSIEQTDLKHELEQANLINAQLQKEIVYLKEEITYLREMMKSKQLGS